MYAALAAPSSLHRGFSPDEIDTMDLSLIARLLGADNEPELPAPSEAGWDLFAAPVAREAPDERN